MDLKSSLITSLRFMPLIAMITVIYQSSCAPASADVYDHSVWKSRSEKNNLDYAFLRNAVANFTDGFFPKDRLMLKYCADWLGETKGKKSEGDNETLLRFEREVAGGLSFKTVDSNRMTPANGGEILISKFKKRMDAEGGKVEETKVTAKKWRGMDGLLFERSFSYPDVAEKIYCVSQLWLYGNREYCMEIAAPLSWFKNKIYGKMINVSLDSVAPFDSYIYQRAVRSKESSSQRKPRKDNSAPPALNVEEIIASLETHVDSERRLRMKCPKDAKWSPRYDKIVFSTRDVTVFELKSDFYDAELTSSWQYIGETLDSAIGEIKSALTDGYWEVVNCDDVRIGGMPGKKIVIRFEHGDPKKPVEIQTSYLVLANSLIYRLQLTTRESLSGKMSKVIDTMASSMVIEW